jgi:hypothetical protein
VIPCIKDHGRAARDPRRWRNPGSWRWLLKLHAKLIGVLATRGPPLSGGRIEASEKRPGKLPIHEYRHHGEGHRLFRFFQQLISKRTRRTTLDLFGDRVRGSPIDVDPWIFGNVEDSGKATHTFPCMYTDLGVITDHNLIVSILLHCIPLPH